MEITLKLTGEELKVLRRALIKEDMYCEEHNLNTGKEQACKLYEKVSEQSKSQGSDVMF